MTARAKLLQAAFADEQDDDQLNLTEQPIFRYSDPARFDTDGTLWLWTENKRPVAILCLFMGNIPGGEWNYEYTSLTDRPLEVSGRPRWRWQPKEQKRVWIELPGEVPAEPAARLRALRAHSRRFEATETWQGETYQLRLLPSPLYHYSDEDTGIIDGALFAMAHGTNPELLVQIEARRERSDRLRWFASFARLGAAPLDVKQGDRTVWSVEIAGPYRFNPRDPYYAAYGADPLPDAP